MDDVRFRGDEYTSLTVHDHSGQVIPVRFGIVDSVDGPALVFELDQTQQFKVDKRDLNHLIRGLQSYNEQLNRGL